MKNFFLNGTPEQNRNFIFSATAILGSFLAFTSLIIVTHFGGIATPGVEATPTGTTAATSTITLTPTRTPNPTSTPMNTATPGF
ncbi:MAG TPA: hypothetical protein VJC17_00735 [Candidatus Dojkabacteria bacterium]|nr:hypothetical protein [Candidatus Dojkabacteria bacterium]